MVRRSNQSILKEIKPEYSLEGLMLKLKLQYFGHLIPGHLMVGYSHLFQNFPQFIVIHTVKGFDIVNKAEIDVFLELFCFFNDPGDVGKLISGSSAFSKTRLNIWKFKVHVLLKPVLEKTLESPLDGKEIKAVNPNENQSWVFFGRNDAEAEAAAPILWPLDAKN